MNRLNVAVSGARRQLLAAPGRRLAPKRRRRRRQCPELAPVRRRSLPLSSGSTDCRTDRLPQGRDLDKLSLTSKGRGAGSAAVLRREPLSAPGKYVALLLSLS